MFFDDSLVFELSTGFEDCSVGFDTSLALTITVQTADLLFVVFICLYVNKSKHKQDCFKKGA